MSLDRRFGLANTAAPAVLGGSMGSRKPSGAVEQRKEAKGKRQRQRSKVKTSNEDEPRTAGRARNGPPLKAVISRDERFRAPTSCQNKAQAVRPPNLVGDREQANAQNCPGSGRGCVVLPGGLDPSLVVRILGGGEVAPAAQHELGAHLHGFQLRDAAGVLQRLDGIFGSKSPHDLREFTVGGHVDWR